jgi:ABC-type branched-subunit amino acid transport system ATPase component
VVDKSVPTVLSLADHVAIPVKGTVACHGSPQTLRREPDMMHRPLGV